MGFAWIICRIFDATHQTFKMCASSDAKGAWTAACTRVHADGGKGLCICACRRLYLGKSCMYIGICFTKCVRTVCVMYVNA